MKFKNIFFAIMLSTAMSQAAVIKCQSNGAAPTFVTIELRQAPLSEFVLHAQSKGTCKVYGPRTYTEFHSNYFYTRQYKRIGYIENYQSDLNSKVKISIYGDAYENSEVITNYTGTLKYNVGTAEEFGLDLKCKKFLNAGNAEDLGFTEEE